MTHANDERPSDDVLEAGFPGATALLRMLVPHDDFGITEDAWRASLRSALDFGCDWLNHFPYEVGGNVVGDAVVKLAVRAEQAEKELEYAKKAPCGCMSEALNMVRCGRLNVDSACSCAVHPERERCDCAFCKGVLAASVVTAHPQPAPSETPPATKGSTQ